MAVRTSPPISGWPRATHVATPILYEYACHEGNARNLELMTGTDIFDTRARTALEHAPRVGK
jgi:hypothetical protein